MIFKNKKSIYKDIKGLVKVNDDNIMASNMFVDFAENYSDQITPSNNEDEYLMNFLEVLEIDYEDENNGYFIKNYIKDNIHELDINEYKNNPYFKNIKINNKRINNIEIKNLSYKPYEGFISDDFKFNYNKEITSIGYFKEEFKYPAILENNRIWMLITPNEINTMKPHIEKAKGNILVCGLGLGYYPYLASLKDEVKSITILETNKDIIDLFKKEILPQFENNNKIKIINESCYSYLKKNSLNFDYTFIDIYHDPIDGILPFIKLSKLKINKSFWLTNGLIAMLRRCLITLIDEEYNCSTDNDYIKTKENTDYIINALHFYFKNYEINDIKDIYKILDFKYLMDLSHRLEIRHN